MQHKKRAENRWLRLRPPNVLGLIAVLGLVGTCSSSDTKPVHKVIGPAGGTIQGPGGVELTIPTGALDEEIEFSIAVVDGESPIGFVPVGSVLEFAPHGTEFNLDVSVRMPFDSNRVTGSSERLDIYWSEVMNGTWAPLGGTVDPAGSITAYISHLSFGAVGKPGGGSSATPEIERVSRLLRREYNRIGKTIPYGSVWDLTISGTSGSTTTDNERYSQSAEAKGTITVPSWNPEDDFYYNYLDSYGLEMARMALEYEFGSLSAVSDAAIGEYLHDWLAYMIPEDVGVRFEGSYTVSKTRGVFQGESFRRTCDACAPLTMPVVADGSVSFSMEGMEIIWVDSGAKEELPNTYQCETVWFSSGTTEQSEFFCFGGPNLNVGDGNADSLSWLDLPGELFDYTGADRLFVDYRTETEFIRTVARIRQTEPREPFTPVPEDECERAANQNCDDGNPCTEDFCDAVMGCVFNPLPDGDLPDANPKDCRKDVCRSGKATTVANDSETPIQEAVGDCSKQECIGGEITGLPDDTDLPPQEDQHDCGRQICADGEPAGVPDDTEIPLQESPSDCYREICDNGEVSSIPYDNETPPQRSSSDCVRQVCRDANVVDEPAPDEPGCT